MCESYRQTHSFALPRPRISVHFTGMEVASTQPRDRPLIARPKDPQRSAIANGKLLPGVDQRNTWVRRAKELIADHISDLGGEANASTAERSIIRRAAVLTVELERLEA